MIGRLNGLLLEKLPPQVLLDVNGVGYEVDVPMTTYYQLPALGERCTLHIHQLVREDAHLLFGFASREERETFRQLIKVTGIGARIALAILSGMNADELARAVATEDIKRLSSVPGIGKKTAERLVVELREKVKLVQLYAEADGTSAPALDVRGDLVSALVNLGYKAAQAEKAADVASQRAGTDAPFELMFREALKGLRSGA